VFVGFLDLFLDHRISERKFGLISVIFIFICIYLVYGE
jgi:hypothetical protein